MELFVEIMPEALCCDEHEEWYFKIYFYNFLYDWLESIQKLRKIPKERREALFVERKELGLFDTVFRLPRSQTEVVKNQRTKGEPKQ